MPFGEEIGTGIGGRTIAMGFAVNDGQRQKFTQKERDSETGLDFFLARYYSAGHGRFISPDEPLADQTPDEPQSWNLYAYVRNNPLRAIDPDGKQSLLEKYRNWRNGYGFKTDKEVRSEECTRRSLLDYVASANETPDRLIITNANTGVETVVIISQMTR